MIINFRDLGDLRKKHSGQKIVLCSGTFDLTHAGHVLFFEDCKKLGDFLVVMVGNDASIRKSKGGNRPILNEDARLKMVDAIKPVDYCFLDYLIGGRDFYFACLRLALQKLKPDKFGINDDANDIPERKKMVDKLGIELVVLSRNCPPEFENISTTKIIDTIRGQ